MKFELLPACPHCQSRDFVTRNCRAYGWAEEQFDEFGNRYCLHTDEKVFFDNRSQTLRCGACGQIRRDLQVIDGRVVAKT